MTAKKQTAREEFLAKYPTLDTVDVAVAKPEELPAGERFVVYQYLNGSFEVRAIQEVAERLIDSQRSAWWPKVFKAIVDGKYTKLSVTPDVADPRAHIKARCNEMRDNYRQLFPDFEMPSTRKLEKDRYGVPIKVFETDNCHFCEVFDDKLYEDLVGEKAEALIEFYSLVMRGEVTKLREINPETDNMTAEAMIKERDKYVVEEGEMQIHDWGTITLIDLHAWTAIGSPADLRPTHYVSLTHGTKPLTRKFYFRVEQDFSFTSRHGVVVNHALLNKQINLLAIELLKALDYTDWLAYKTADRVGALGSARRELTGFELSTPFGILGASVLDHSVDSLSSVLRKMDFKRKPTMVMTAAGKEVELSDAITTFSLTTINDITKHENVVNVDVDEISREISVDIGPWAFSTNRHSGIKAAINTLWPGVTITLYANPGHYPDSALVQKITDIDYEALESQVGPKLHNEVFEPCEGVTISLENATFRFVFE